MRATECSSHFARHGSPPPETMLNFNGDFDGHGNCDVRSKQTITVTKNKLFAFAIGQQCEQALMSLSTSRTTRRDVPFACILFCATYLSLQSFLFSIKHKCNVHLTSIFTNRYIRYIVHSHNPI